MKKYKNSIIILLGMIFQIIGLQYTQSSHSGEIKQSRVRIEQEFVSKGFTPVQAEAIAAAVAESEDDAAHRADSLVWIVVLTNALMLLCITNEPRQPGSNGEA
jgi:hypothetical protein